MDIRADVQRTYRSSYLHGADRSRALIEATRRFTDLAGYTPEPSLMDKLLSGALLGHDHPLMQLLDAAHLPQEAPTLGLAASGLKPSTR